LSEIPIAYLARWRLQLGPQMLKSTSSRVAQNASEVGYESESAFNRVFKREFGASRTISQSCEISAQQAGRRATVKRCRSAKG